LKNHLVFVGSGDMPQESLRVLLVDERHKRTAVSAPRCVQLDYMVAVINTALEGRRSSSRPESSKLSRSDSNFYSIRAFNLSIKSAADYCQCRNCKDGNSGPELAGAHRAFGFEELAIEHIVPP
jgi:hypothetical protein